MKRERKGQKGEARRKQKSERGKAKHKDKGENYLLILDVTCKPQSHLSESLVPLNCTQIPPISFLVPV